MRRRCTVPDENHLFRDFQRKRGEKKNKEAEKLDLLAREEHLSPLSTVE
jgi:hypothetical protein